MTASLETLVIAAYVFATSLPIPRSGPAGKATDQELIALAVAQAVLGIPSDRQFLGLVEKILPGWFPELPGQTEHQFLFVGRSRPSCRSGPAQAPTST